MEVSKCGLGIKEPVFHPPSDIQGIKEDFYTHGIAFLDGFDEETLKHLAGQFGEVVRPRNNASGTGISKIRYEPAFEEKGFSTKGYTAEGRTFSTLAEMQHTLTRGVLLELYFHTDRSGWDNPPRVLVSTMTSTSATGGESLLADTVRVVEDVKKYGHCMYELITNAKHSRFRSDEGVFVHRPIFDEKTGLFRFRFDEDIKLSPVMMQRFSVFLKLIYRNAFAISLKEGQGYLVDNHRFLHGRTSFTGKRELLRALVNVPPPQAVVTILFDVDGTLCRSEELSIDAYYSCLSDIVGKPITHANTAVKLHGRTDLGLLHDILDYHGVASKTSIVEKFFENHPQYLQKSLEKGFISVACPGVKDTLEWLKVKKENLRSPNLRVGLLTGNSRPNALRKLQAADIDPAIFDLSISSFGDTHFDRFSLIQDSMAKLHARDGPDLHQSKVIIVGDTPLDIECAKQAGCAVVAVASGNYDMDDLAVLEPDHACIQISESKAYLDFHLGDSAPMIGG
ncbi:HAD-like domain-containing protein [Aspergillus egyptiacus]|nr:HAD-like domain-containing protein [Aspergillus egyptiacus]